MFKIWSKQADEKPATGAEELESMVRLHLEGADVATVRIVSAIAGLLATVAYADSRFSDDEAGVLRTELERVDGLTDAGVAAVCALLRERAASISAVDTPHFTRALRELADRDLRLEILGLLIKLAAADGNISLVEVNLLRQLTSSLGLTQEDMNQLQAAYRDKLTFLR